LAFSQNFTQSPDWLDPPVAISPCRHHSDIFGALWPNKIAWSWCLVDWERVLPCSTKDENSVPKFKFQLGNHVHSRHYIVSGSNREPVWRCLKYRFHGVTPWAQREWFDFSESRCATTQPMSQTLGSPKRVVQCKKICVILQIKNVISDWVCSSKWRGLRAKFGNYRCGERRQTLALFVWIFCYQDQSDWCLFSSHPDFRSDVRLFWCNFGWASIVMGYIKQEWLLWNSTFEMILTSYTFYICCCYAHCMPFLIGAYPSCKLNCNLRIHIIMDYYPLLSMIFPSPWLHSTTKRLSDA